MFRKIILFITFMILVICISFLYLVKNLDVDELNLCYGEYRAGTLYLYDSFDSLVGNYNCKSGDCFLAYSYNETVLDNVTYVDEVKKNIDMTIPIFGDFSFIYDNGFVNLVNMKTEEIIESFVGAKYLENGYIVLKNTENKSALALFNESGLSYISDFSYDYIGKSNLSNDFLVKKDDDYYIVNYLNNKISETFSEKIINYSEMYIVINDKNGYSVYDYNKKKIFVNDYTMIKLDDNFLYLITNNLLSIYTYELDKLNVEYINLGTVVNWNNYYIYNEDNKFLYESSVFDSSYNKDDNILRISTSNNDYSFELISSDFYYLETFKNVIYIYNEITKENLIGSYVCDNDCTIATFESSYIQFLENKYVLINDGNEFILYNVWNASIEKKYSSLNYYLDDLIILTDDNNKIGMIKVNEQVEEVVDFIYEKYSAINGEIIFINEETEFKYVN